MAMVYGAFKHSLVSGLGDYLMGLNKTLHLFDLLNISYVHMPSSIGGRINHPDIDCFIGLDTLSREKVSLASFKEVSFSEACYCIDNKLQFEGQGLVVRFDLADYNTVLPTELVKLMSLQENGFHPALRSAVLNSPLGDLSREYRNQYAERPITSVHIRRGDIAVADLSLLESLVDVEKLPGRYFYTHNDVFFNDLDSELYLEAQSFRYSHVSKYTSVIDELLNKHIDLGEIVLLSDGFSHIAAKLAMHIDSTATLVEKQLVKEFDSLLERSTKAFIGESSKDLELTMAHIMCSDIVVHGNSCFPLALTGLNPFSKRITCINVETYKDDTIS